MNNLQNKVQLTGQLCQQVQLSHTTNSKLKAQVSIEANGHLQKGDMIEIQWHHLVGWGETAEFMSLLLNKGSEVAVQGEIQHRQYLDEQGRIRYYAEVVVSEFLLLG